jgi:hypothetical protein
MVFAIRLHESVGMGDGYTVDATRTTGLQSAWTRSSAGTAGFALGGSAFTEGSLKRFSLLT